MKLRWEYFAICLITGLVLLAAGLLVPAHLRALDESVLRAAGQNRPSLAEAAQTLAGEKKLGAAQLLAQAAQIKKIPGWEKLDGALAGLDRQYPHALFWGDDVRLENRFADNFKPSDQNLPFASFIIRPENRSAALAQLQGSPNAAVQALLHSRSLTQTAIFAPSSSAAGQAFDAAVATGGLLLAGGHLTMGLSDDILKLANQAGNGGGSLPLEQALLDFTSLAERLNWDQLTAFTAHIPDAGTLRQLAGAARAAGDQLPVLFAVVQLSGRPGAVAEYLAKYPETGMRDLGRSLRYGAGGVGELARSGQPLYGSALDRRMAVFTPADSFLFLAAKLAFFQPQTALVIKWFFYLCAGFLLALAVHFIVPAPVPQLRVGGIHLFREILFSLGFLLVVLILTEPFLGQDIQRGDFSLRLLPSAVGGAVLAETAGLQPTIMNPTIIITLLVFFVLQALIYISCLLKLAEINRQNVPARIKLKLLENEDHLFDAGLYLGFVGTIASLIIASMGLVKFSLMAAYSSTSFGIIFVVIFKIFHLRPARRRLLMEAELQNPAPSRVPATVPASPVTP